MYTPACQKGVQPKPKPEDSGLDTDRNICMERKGRALLRLSTFTLEWYCLATHIRFVPWIWFIIVPFAFETSQECGTSLGVARMVPTVCL
jgi:hypothetical protein